MGSTCVSFIVRVHLFVPELLVNNVFTAVPQTSF